MSNHPLFDLAIDREIKKVTGFRKAAMELSGEKLRELYEIEKENAPHLHELEAEYFIGHDGELVNPPKSQRDEHLAIALYNFGQKAGEPYELPDGTPLELLDYSVPMALGPEAKALGSIELLGLTGEGRLCILGLKFVPPTAARGTTGETPLRALLEGLSRAAIVEANFDAIEAEIKKKLKKKLKKEPPIVMVLGNLRYWELCRKRDAQSGAAWINEMERLAKETTEATGVAVQYLGLELVGDPGWTTADKRPELEGAPELLTAWEPGAGRPKPKSRARSRAIDEIVLADPSRPTRSYGMTEIYSSGDTIEHHTLGKGVVQRELGPKKIEVLFEDRRRVLVHARPVPGELAAE